MRSNGIDVFFGFGFCGFGSVLLDDTNDSAAEFEQFFIIGIIIVAYSPSGPLHRSVTPGNLRSPQRS